jgi:hypothetical protein
MSIQYLPITLPIIAVDLTAMFFFFDIKRKRILRRWNPPLAWPARKRSCRFGGMVVLSQNSNIVGISSKFLDRSLEWGIGCGFE